jgi:hypothetical protein
MSIPSKQSGYTLLFAVLVSSLVLGVAVFISNTARKQYILSSTALDSMYSFYAADSGIECVAESGVPGTTTPKVITCDNQLVIPTYSIPTNPSIAIGDNVASIYQSSNNISFLFKDSSCAVITIYSYLNSFDTPTASSTTHTIIVSRGYNLCKTVGTTYTPDTDSPRTVERALRLDYQ